MVAIVFGEIIILFFVIGVVFGKILNDNWYIKYVIF